MTRRIKNNDELIYTHSKCDQCFLQRVPNGCEHSCLLFCFRLGSFLSDCVFDFRILNCFCFSSNFCFSLLVSLRFGTVVRHYSIWLISFTFFWAISKKCIPILLNLLLHKCIYHVKINQINLDKKNTFFFIIYSILDFVYLTKQNLKKNLLSPWYI